MLSCSDRDRFPAMGLWSSQRLNWRLFISWDGNSHSRAMPPDASTTTIAIFEDDSRDKKTQLPNSNSSEDSNISWKIYDRAKFKGKSHLPPLVFSAICRTQFDSSLLHPSDTQMCRHHLLESENYHKLVPVSWKYTVSNVALVRIMMVNMITVRTSREHLRRFSFLLAFRFWKDGIVSSHDIGVLTMQAFVEV